MTSNLKITNETISSEDSDFTSISSYSVPASSATGWGGSWSRSMMSTNQNNGENSGYLYNYHLAVVYPNGQSVRANIAPTESICPKNWQLPTNLGSKSFYNLITTAYSITDISKLISEPLSFEYTGFYYGTDELVNLDYGYYLSNTTYSTNVDWAYGLRFEQSSGIRPQHEGLNKDSGSAIRCVAR